MSAYLGTVTLVNLGLGTVLAGVLALLGLPNPVLWEGSRPCSRTSPYVGPAIGIGLVTLASLVTFPTAGTALLPPLAYFALPPSKAIRDALVARPPLCGAAARAFVWLAIGRGLWSVARTISAVPMLMLFKFISTTTPRLAAVAFFMRRCAPISLDLLARLVADRSDPTLVVLGGSRR